MSCKPFRTPQFLFFAFKLNVLETKVEARFETLPCDVFSCSAGFFEQIFYAFAKKLDKLFWARLKEKTLHLWENDWNTWRLEEFCVFIVKNIWLFQLVRDIKIQGNRFGVCTKT